MGFGVTDCTERSEGQEGTRGMGLGVTSRRIIAIALDVLLLGFALLEAWDSVNGANLPIAAVMLPCFALLLRRRAPLPVFLVTLPAPLIGGAEIASLVALFTVAERFRSRAVLVAGAIMFAVCRLTSWPVGETGEFSDPSSLTTVGFVLAEAAAAVALGQLVQARHDLSLRLVEIGEVREHERQLVAQTVLATERAQLAREMHDVVSHQVSLIAVQAGALQVSTGDPEAKQVATTIRRLSVHTLDELRHMVSVLRGPGRPQMDLTPQPTLSELEQLVAASGIEAALQMDKPGALPARVERAIYRTVQESLTNVRKHAPGASATVRIHRTNDTVVTTVTNGAATRPALDLPSAQHGLIGLRQRAELLGGTLHTGPTPNGGYRLRLELPAAQAP
jgi:signal transduction histidine kinase